jgi:hypothetical protein
MADFNVKADGVDVEQIMRQIRSRIRDKRGVDYTEEQIQELAKVKLERFLDPKGVRSDLLEQFRRMPSDVPPIYPFDDKTLIASSKPLVRFFRRLFQPLLKMMFNLNALNHVLHTQAGINDYLMKRSARDVLVYEVLHNLVVEVTRSSIEVKNMKMRVESIASRLEFNERRARALEAVVQYKSDHEPGPRGAGDGGRASRPQERERDHPRDRERRVVHSRQHGQAPAGGEAHPNPPDPMTGGESLRSRRKRRRRGRRSGPGFAEGANPTEGSSVNPAEAAAAREGEETSAGNDREATSPNAGDGNPGGDSGGSTAGEANAGSDRGPSES